MNVMLLDIIACYEQKPKPKEFVLPGLVRGTVGSIISPGGQGKSMLTLQLAHLVAGGIDKLDFSKSARLSQGQVGYLSMEDGADTIHERLHAIGSRLSQYEREICSQNIFAVDLTKNGFDLFKVEQVEDDRGRSTGRTKYPYREAIARFCEGKSIVFLDTLRSFHTGDENNGGQMAELINWMRQTASITNCAIVFLHHTNKSSATAGDGDLQQASRGSSVLVDNIRWQGFLSGMSKDEAKKYSVSDDRRGYFVRFGVSKQNYGKPFDEIWFKRGDGGVLEPAFLEEKQPIAKKDSETAQKNDIDGKAEMEAKGWVFYDKK